jgi:GH25 family lysozyme M1 (1,4-beta-N-acetylmuramidase)
MARLLALFAWLIAAPAFAERPDPHYRPWAHERSVIVVDAWELNDIDFDALAADPKVVGLIHRAVIGNVVDARYAERAAEAKRRGLLWGAYHLGVEGDPVGQADLFLDTVGDHAGVLLALDLEDVDDPRRMNIAEAIRFIERVRARTGRTPVIYGNRKVIAALSDSAAFQRAAGAAPIWYARYREEFYPEDLGVWRSYLLWQFSSEVNCWPGAACLHRAPPGVQTDIDLNVFPGTREELAALWTAGQSPPAFAGPYVRPPDPVGDAERAVQAALQQAELDRLRAQSQGTQSFGQR